MPDYLHHSLAYVLRAGLAYLAILGACALGDVSRSISMQFAGLLLIFVFGGSGVVLLINRWLRVRRAPHFAMLARGRHVTVVDGEDEGRAGWVADVDLNGMVEVVMADPTPYDLPSVFFEPDALVPSS